MSPRGVHCLQRVPFLPFLAVLAALAATAAASPSLRGRVFAEDGKPLPGARVGLAGTRTVATTDDSGRFLLPATPIVVDPPVPRLRVTRRSGGWDVRAAEPIQRLRLVRPDGSLLFDLAPETTSLFVPFPPTSGLGFLQTRTASGKSWVRLGPGSTSSPRTDPALVDPEEPDSLCVRAGDRPIVRLPIPPDGRSVDIRLKTGRWTTGDLHTHTVLTDGSHTQADILAHAFGGTYAVLDGTGTKKADSTVPSYGLDWMANSEHGGAYGRSVTGLGWDTQARTAALGNPPAGTLWRWQTLREHSWPLLDSLRRVYPAHPLVQGVEWNVPTHDHASVGILANTPDPIATFEYLFDAQDGDTSGGAQAMGIATPKPRANTHAKALAGIAWLQSHHRDSSYMVANHPSRILGYSASDLRDFAEAGPDVFLGIEAFPGHQRTPYRGLYGSSDPSARTWGGADPFLARLGGLADALWSEGRRFWVFSNSDFHVSSPTNDFYPGSFNQNRVFADDGSMASVLAGMRRGTAYAQIGGLVAFLDLVADDGVEAARMGGTLRATDSVTLLVRYRPGPDASPPLHHLDLIAGEVGPRAAPGTPGWSRDTAPKTRILRTFLASDFRDAGQGVREASMRVEAGSARYYRLRGTNVPPSTANESDAQGNPLVDPSGTNDEAAARRDLWVYTNPVWVGSR